MTDEEKPIGKLLVLPVAHREQLDAIVTYPPVKVVDAWHDHLRDPAKCHHPSVTVFDGKARRVECSTCETDLDAISILMEYARADRAILRSLEGVRTARIEAEKETAEIQKALVALRRKRSSEATRHPFVSALTRLRTEVAKELRAHPDEDVQRVRSRVRFTLDSLIKSAISRITNAEAES